MARSRSTRKWLKAHAADASVRAAQRHGYRSRAVYKLIEIDQRDRLISQGMTVVDLGAAPGSWSQYCIERLGPRGRLIALDILPMELLPGAQVMQRDFRDESTLDELLRHLHARPAHLVLSDMAPNISGLAAIDQPRAMQLAETALDLARQILARDGSFLVKAFQGEGFEDFIRELRECFRKVVIRKPRASRERSREVYVLARHTVCSKV